MSEKLWNSFGHLPLDKIKQNSRNFTESMTESNVMMKIVLIDSKVNLYIIFLCNRVPIFFNFTFFVTISQILYSHHIS